PGNLSFFTDGFCLYQKRGAEQELLVACQQEERAEYCVADGTTVIGESAFAGNEYLKCIVLPGTVQEIRQSAFEGCRGLERIEIPEVNLSEAGLKKGKPKYLSADNSFTGYEGSVPEKKSCVCGLHSIGENAFSHCICLKEIHLPATLETLGRFALSDTYGWSETLIGLERITVSNANTHFMADEDALFEIGNGRDRYLVKYFGRGSTYQIPEDVTRILAGAFRRARFRKCWVPKSVWDVGEDAFRECSALEEVELEESGLRLYVPRQPVYRKDEIMELFYSAERETRLESARKNRMEEKHGSGRWSILDFPEKWKDFAAFYPKQERKVWHSSERYVYDYQGYDALFPTYLSLPEKCGIACCRLRCPVQLAEPSAAEYRKFIAENLTGILHEISKTQDISRLADLAELGFFTGDNIGDCLEVFAQSGSAKCTGFLLGYQREHHLGEDAFDFSL
ncbi:MAG: leucine-rich repeat domain-containing protein, partial [Clostridiales bacterium]|nr:leucine-rich repeat domain-containing protein [Clostridiales bacterium]